MSWVLEDYFRKYRFVRVADYLGLDLAQVDARDAAEQTKERSFDSRFERRKPAPLVPSIVESQPEAGAGAARRLTPVSVVVPCYNEESILPYLSNTLRGVEAELRDDYELHFVFVDDGSGDDTFASLRRLFGARPNTTFVRHQRNLGVAASILDGIRHARTEIVCSMDCDCTYDPHDLANMIPLLADGVDLVTASPYHPRGRVRNVPAWRLTLSRGASFLYRQVLRQKLFTYTSCFRVHRRDALIDLRLREPGFLGVAEIVGRLDLRGAKIVEYPATLEVRLFGHSKMKVVKTVGGHLRLLARLLAMRVRAADGSRPKPAAIELSPEVALKVGYERRSVNPQE